MTSNLSQKVIVDPNLSQKVIVETKESKSVHYCYIVRIKGKDRTYVGYTVEPKRRIRQHNGIIKGGAKATSISNQWEFLAILTSQSPLFTKNVALSVEWHLKHADGKRKTSPLYRGVQGKLRSIIEVLNRYSFDFTVYVDELERKRLEELRNEAEGKKDLTNPNSNVIQIEALDKLLESVTTDAGKLLESVTTDTVTTVNLIGKELD